MKRKIYSELNKWKESKNRLPLLIYGARQIGKTYALQYFGKEHYAKVVYVNFEMEQALVAYFEISLDPEYLLKVIGEYYKVKIEAENTLIIFDEIQSSERALTSLKYFAESGKDYHIIGAGSLLGVKINRDKFSFPVGKVQIIHMYPMDFEEFLCAADKQSLADLIKTAYMTDKPLPELLHQEALQLYKEFLIVGGMPAAVKAYIAGDNYQQWQELIYNAYIADTAKYTERTDNLRIMLAYESLPAQLGKENRKFQYKVIKSGARASQFADAIEWLVQAGIVMRCRLVKNGEFPLVAYEEPDCFKLYYSDTGLFAYKSGLTIANIDKAGQFVGAITENYVAAALKANEFKLNYWTSNSIAEIDFVIEIEGNVIPVEVKANTHVRSKSLDVFRKRYNSELAIRISARNFGRENGLKAVPLYAVFAIGCAGINIK